jgi:hypothetical protein
MTVDAEIYRAANMLIQQYGEKATTRAAIQVDEYRAKRDTASQEVWEQILEAVREILSQEIPADAKLH